MRYTLLATFALTACAASQRPPCEDRDAAFDAANAFILDRLKAPATATFPEIGGKDVLAQWEDNPKGKCGFVVSSYVDSENSFGAKIRDRFFVHIYHTGEGEWQLEREPLFVSDLR